MVSFWSVVRRFSSFVDASADFLSFFIHWWSVFIHFLNFHKYLFCCVILQNISGPSVPSQREVAPANFFLFLLHGWQLLLLLSPESIRSWYWWSVMFGGFWTYIESLHHRTLRKLRLGVCRIHTGWRFSVIICIIIYANMHEISIISVCISIFTSCLLYADEFCE